MVEFIYDVNDYKKIPGLIRPHDDDIPYLCPVFFNLEVLIKYFYHPDYLVTLASDTYGNIEYKDKWMTPFGINPNKKVIMWLGNILKLPENEQYYLRSENIPSDHNIESEFYDAQINIEFTEPTMERKLFESRNKLAKRIFDLEGLKITRLDIETVDIMKNLKRVLYDSEDVFQSAVNNLNKILVESINERGIRHYLKENHSTENLGELEELRGMKLFAKYCKIDLGIENIDEIISPLFVLYDFRIISDHLLSKDEEENKMKYCLERLGLDKGEKDYRVIYETLMNSLIKMYQEITKSMEEIDTNS